VESIFFFFLLLQGIFIVSVDDTPLLISGAHLGSDSNILSLLIFVVVNLHDLALDVDKHVSSESE
jgi:hypothetical protein